MRSVMADNALITSSAVAPKSDTATEAGAITYGSKISGTRASNQASAEHMVTASHRKKHCSWGLSSMGPQCRQGCLAADPLCCQTGSSALASGSNWRYATLSLAGRALLGLTQARACSGGSAATLLILPNDTTVH